MELRLVRYLLAVADERQFTRAAARLNIAQPALSQQIQKFEHQLGLPLLNRTPRDVTLTAAGEIVAVHGRRMLAEAETALAELQQLAGLATGRLVIGATPTLGAFDLSAVLARFHEDHPNVELAVREGLSLRLCDALLEDRLDLAFVTLKVDASAQLEFAPVASEELVGIVAEDHRLAGGRSTTLHALRDEPFAMFGGGATIRQELDERAETAGFRLTVAFETNDLFRTRELVSRGLAVAIVPRSDAERPGPRVKILRLRDTRLIHEIRLSWKRGAGSSPAARRFRELVLAP